MHAYKQSNAPFKQDVRLFGKQVSAKSISIKPGVEEINDSERGLAIIKNMEHIKKLVFEFGVSCKPLSIAS